MRIFQSDSPLMEGLSRISDLVILNMVTLVCCLPVITIGAAMTGMHYVLLKMARNEEGYIVRSYFKAFKENFRQATCMWLFFLIFGAVFAMDVNLTGGAGIAFPPALRLLIIAGGIFIFLMYLYAFPLLARFQNTVFGTLRNAAVLAARLVPADSKKMLRRLYADANAKGFDACRFGGNPFGAWHEREIMERIAPLGPEECDRSLRSDEPDFEDGLIRACAELNGVDFILTRDTGAFRTSPVKALTCAEYLELVGEAV